MSIPAVDALTGDELDRRSARKDGREIVAHGWFAPDAALEAHEDGRGGGTLGCGGGNLDSRCGSTALPFASPSTRTDTSVAAPPA